MKAKSGDAKAISENMALFESEWNAVKTDSELAHKVDERLLAVKNALEKDNNSETNQTAALFPFWIACCI